MASYQSAQSPAPKAIARVAMVGLDEFTATTFRSCLSQFGVLGITLEGDPQQRLSDEKFEGCAIALDGRFVPCLQGLRSSPLNKRIVIYGFGEGAQAAVLCSRFGVNAILPLPLERTAALQVVRASHALLANELRRYVRVPLAVEVKLMLEGKSYKVWSEEISSGGMALKCQLAPKKYTAVIVSFDLPGHGRISITCRVCWLDIHGRVGISFGHQDPAREAVRSWIDRYLQIA